MKRNLLRGIILISAIALSSCSTLNTISKSKDTGDDVYYTKAKANDNYEWVAPQYAQQPVIAPVRNDDYYYYGDYESRIKRFSYFTPFDYDDDFYYDYTPYNYYGQQPQIAAANNVGYDPGYDPGAYDFGTYDAFDFGYGDYGGYDNYGFGAAFSTFIYGGGSRTRHTKYYSHTNNNTSSDGLTFTRANGSNRVIGGPGLSFAKANGGVSNAGNGSGPAFSRGSSVSGATPNLTFTRANASNNGNSVAYSGGRPGGNNSVYPGRPGTNAAVTSIPATPNTTTRYVRPQSENPRQEAPQPVIQRASPVIQNSGSNSSSSSSSGSSNSGNSSGGGGRPVRP